MRTSTALEAIRAATTTADAVMGWDHQIGTLQAGRLPDMIAVPGDALKDLRILLQPVLVMQGGRLIPPDIGTWPREAPAPPGVLTISERRSHHQ